MQTPRSQKNAQKLCHLTVSSSSSLRQRDQHEQSGKFKEKFPKLGTNTLSATATMSTASSATAAVAAAANSAMNAVLPAPAVAQSPDKYLPSDQKKDAKLSFKLHPITKKDSAQSSTFSAAATAQTLQMQIQLQTAVAVGARTAVVGGTGSAMAAKKRPHQRKKDPIPIQNFDISIFDMAKYSMQFRPYSEDNSQTNKVLAALEEKKEEAAAVTAVSAQTASQQQQQQQQSQGSKGQQRENTQVNSKARVKSIRKRRLHDKQEEEKISFKETQSKVDKSFLEQILQIRERNTLNTKNEKSRFVDKIRHIVSDERPADGTPTANAGTSSTLNATESQAAATVFKLCLEEGSHQDDVENCAQNQQSSTCQRFESPAIFLAKTVSERQPPPPLIDEEEVDESIQQESVISYKSIVDKSPNRFDFMKQASSHGSSDNNSNNSHEKVKQIVVSSKNQPGETQEAYILTFPQQDHPEENTPTIKQHVRKQIILRTPRQRFRQNVQAAAILQQQNAEVRADLDHQNQEPRKRAGEEEEQGHEEEGDEPQDAQDEGEEEDGDEEYQDEDGDEEDGDYQEEDEDDDDDEEEEGNSSLVFKASEDELTKQILRMNTVHSLTESQEICKNLQRECVAQSFKQLAEEAVQTQDQSPGTLKLEEWSQVHGKSIRWRLGNFINCGTFGQVFRAMNIDTGEIMAVRKLIIGERRDKQFLKEIEEELTIMKRLKHPNIVKYLGHDQIDKNVYIYLEYMDQGNITMLLQRYGPLRDQQIKTYAQQILEGLVYLHSERVIHRDIKGANILVSTNSQVKLADFGCAKSFEVTLSSLSLESDKENFNRTLKGSVPWMAPEVIKQTKYTQKADIWSFGCSILEMATAKIPWSQYDFDNPITAIMRIGLSEEIPAIPETLSGTLRDFILVCLKREYKQRPSAQELLRHPFLQP